MVTRFKPVHEQVIVIVGASSGIGLATARMAAARGARVLLVARNEADLQSAANDIRQNGGRAAHAVADAATATEIDTAAEEAVRQFGRIDTWVNAAAVALYGSIVDLAEEDMRRQMDVIFWGVVHGSRTAVRHLRDDGGVLVNVASVLADRAVPLQGIYCAAKHAIRGFTDTLRMELEAAGLPVSVTLIKPASVDTPLFEKSKSLLGVEPQPVPPVYAPDVVARAILECAERPIRDLVVGGGALLLPGLNTAAPRLLDRYMEWRLFAQQKTDRPLDEERRDNLHSPVAHDGGVRGTSWQGRVKNSSAYTWSRLHPAAALAATAALVTATVAIVARQSAEQSR